MRRLLGGGALLYASGLLWACSDDVDSFDRAPTIMATEVVGSKLVLVDSGSDEIDWLSVAGTNPRPELDRHRLPATPVVVQSRNGASELLVLCRVDSDAEEDEAVGMLVVADADGIDRRYELGTRYDSIQQSKDGRYAFLSTTGSTGTSILSNPNDITIVDLQADSSVESMQRTLTSQGESPRAVVFSPELAVDGAPLRLALVLYPSGVTLIDLAHLDDPEFPTFRVQLPSAAQLTQAVFSPEEGRIYLRGESSSDLFLLQLIPSDPGIENRFEPVLNQIGMRSNVSDLIRFDLGSGERLLATAGAQVLLVDVSSSQVTALDLNTSASKMMEFDQDGQPYAMLYQIGSATVSFVDLSGIEERPQHSVEHVPIQGTYTSLQRLTESEVLLKVGGTGISILNLQTRTVAPIRSSAALTQAPVFDEAMRKVWIAPDASDTIAVFGLDGLQPQELRLDSKVERLLVVPNEDSPKVVVLHPSSFGYLTLIDATAPSRKTAVSLRGYLHEGALDKGED